MYVGTIFFILVVLMMSGSGDAQSSNGYFYPQPNPPFELPTPAPEQTPTLPPTQPPTQPVIGMVLKY